MVPKITGPPTTWNSFNWPKSLVRGVPEFAAIFDLVWHSARSCSIIATAGVIRTLRHTLRKADDVADLKKGARITGNTRDKLAADLKKKYEKGASIRALAESTGRSYGFVHRVLSESGVTLRGRGGATRTKKK
jgi:hypothetical protein